MVRDSFNLLRWWHDWRFGQRLYRKQIWPVSSALMFLEYDEALMFTVHLAVVSIPGLILLIFLHCSKGGLLLNNIFIVIGAALMAFSKLANSYELIIVGRFFVGINSGKFKRLGRSVLASGPSWPQWRHKYTSLT